MGKIGEILFDGIVNEIGEKSFGGIVNKTGEILFGVLWVIIMKQEGFGEKVKDRGDIIIGEIVA